MVFVLRRLFWVFRLLRLLRQFTGSGGDVLLRFPLVFVLSWLFGVFGLLSNPRRERSMDNPRRERPPTKI